MLGVGQKVFDIFYPIGSYYETSDTNFNPNTANSWYGTWVEDTKGQVLVSRKSGTFATVGNNIGEETHTLNVNELPSHNHGFYANLVFAGNGSDGALSTSRADIRADWHIGNTGGGQAHNNIQPSKVVIRWHRTA